MKLIVTITIILLSLNLLLGQDVMFTFDDCSLADSSGQFPSASTTSIPDCRCGLEANGMYFDGNQDNIVFDEGLDSLLEKDFTLSFYFRIDEATSNTDILSIRTDCGFDSILSLTYLPASNELNLQMGNSIGNLEVQSLSVDASKCWHRFVLTKVDLLYTYYLDDDFASFVSPTTIEFGDGASLSISNSPCLVNGSVSRFNGWIDEFIITQRALSSVEIQDGDLMPDQILTQDTTIIQGASVDIIAGATCAQTWSWSPTASIDDPTALDITVAPDETTTYTLEINNVGGCTTTDAVSVFVLDEDDLDCENLLLPNAFTPNNDQLNDTYGISNLFLVDAIEYFEIYDRWGAKLWETNQKDDRWDGSYQGDKLNPGMYIYKIKYSCKSADYVKVDNFSILR